MPIPLSIILPAHNQATELRQHLPLILEQDFEEFEVIVVDIASTDETKDVLEGLELQYTQLRHTHTPASARDISLEWLALTLGVRAAKHEWVVLSRADCQPASTQWLQHISAAATEEKSILLGIAKYEEHRHTWFDQKVAFFRLWTTLANLRHVQAGNSAVRADECNVAIRRTLFLGQENFGTNLNLLTGAVELMVNHLSNAGNTGIVTEPEALVIQDSLPSKRLWMKHRVFYMETRRHLRNTGLYRLKQDLRMAFPWLLLAAVVAIWPAVIYFQVPQTLPLWILLGLVGLLLLIILIYKSISFNNAARSIGYERRFYLSLPWLALALPLWNANARLRYRFTPKNEFRKKFV